MEKSFKQLMHERREHEAKKNAVKRREKLESEKQDD